MQSVSPDPPTCAPAGTWALVGAPAQFVRWRKASPAQVIGRHSKFPGSVRKAARRQAQAASAGVRRNAAAALTDVLR